VNQGQKQQLSKGRGSIVGGTTLSSTKLSGSKFWKYLLRKYGLQLLKPDEVPPYLNAFTEIVTTNHVSNQTNGKFGHRSCSACSKEYGTSNHGHSKGGHHCPLRDVTNVPHTKYIAREERKVNECRELGGVPNSLSNE